MFVKDQTDVRVTETAVRGTGRIVYNGGVKDLACGTTSSSPALALGLKWLHMPHMASQIGLLHKT